MDITISKKDLIDAVIIAVRFSERRSTTLPVLASVLITADEHIRLQATNLETSVDLSVEGTIKKPGTVALPAQILREITSSLSGSGTISLAQEGDTVVLSGEGIKSTLKTLPTEDFPAIPVSNDTRTTFSLPGNALRPLITLVAQYASPSTVRPELASVLLKAEGGVVTAVATDSFRLAEKKLPTSGTIPQFSLLIPAKNALSIAETLPDEEVTIHADEHQCSFSWKGNRLTTRLVAAEYPDYTQIIPKSFMASATVLRKDFESSLRRTAIFSDSFQKIRLALSVKQKKLALSSRNNDVGETKEEITAATEGEDIELSFNHRYLSAPLSSFSSESISLSASGIGRPLVIKAVGDTSFLYLVMPMNQ